MSRRRLPQVRAWQNALDNTTRERAVLAVDVVLKGEELERAAKAMCSALERLERRDGRGAEDAARVLRDGLPKFEHTHEKGVYGLHCLACVVDEMRSMQLARRSLALAPGVQ